MINLHSNQLQFGIWDQWNFCFWILKKGATIITQFTAYYQSQTMYVTPLHTWNPNDPCFDWKRPCFGGLTFKNRGHLGSRYTYIYIYIQYTHIHFSGSRGELFGRPQSRSEKQTPTNRLRVDKNPMREIGANKWRHVQYPSLWLEM